MDKLNLAIDYTASQEESGKVIEYLLYAVYIFFIIFVF
jgi:hypothetical protein